MDFLGGFFENLWLKIVRYNIITGRFKVGSIDLSPTRSVADITELQAIDKVAENDNLIVHVRSLPRHRSILIFKFATLSWEVVTGRQGVASDSIMWLGDAYLGNVATSSGTHPLLPARTAYNSSSPTWVNLANYIRNFRASPGCGTGTGTMAFNKTNRTLAWKAPGETTGGPNNDGYGVPVNTSVGGWYRLESATAGKDCLVAIRVVNEPAAAGVSTDSVVLSGTPVVYNLIATYVGLFNAMFGNPFGERQYYYTMNALDVTQALLCSSQWEFVDTDVTVIDILSASSRSTIALVDTTLASLLTVVKKRQAIGSRVIVIAPTLYNAASDATMNFLPYITRKLKYLAETNNFEVVDTNPYMAAKAGTLSDPARTDCLNSSDLQYLSVIGSLIRIKYGFLPVISKYLPTRNKIDHELIPYSATEPFGNLLTNGRLTGVAGTKTDGSSGRITGDVPTSFDLALTTTGGHTMTAVCVSPDSGAPVARGEGLPFDVFQITLANVAVDGETATFKQAASISSLNYAAGDVLQFSGEVSFTGTNGGFHVISGFLTASNLRVDAFNSFLASNQVGNINGETLTMGFVTPPMTLQAGVSTLNFNIVVQMKAGGTGVIKVSPNLCIKKVIY